MNKINLKEYSEFVAALTSRESTSKEAFFDRCRELELDAKTNVPLLLTAAIGLASESGEFSEIVKKCIFQGKPLDENAVRDLSKELGDVMWYWINACRALNLDPNEVIRENIGKLNSRYPGGRFDARLSAIRKSGDT